MGDWQKAWFVWAYGRTPVHRKILTLIIAWPEFSVIKRKFPSLVIKPLALRRLSEPEGHGELFQSMRVSTLEIRCQASSMIKRMSRASHPFQRVHCSAASAKVRVVT